MYGLDVIREARLIVPSAPFANAHYNRLAIAEIEERIIRDFGGFTRTHGFGRWHSDDYGVTTREDVLIYDIACADVHLNNVALRHLADEVRKDLNQLSVYLRLPNGNVEYVEGEHTSATVVLDEPDSHPAEDGTVEDWADAPPSFQA